MHRNQILSENRQNGMSLQPARRISAPQNQTLHPRHIATYFRSQECAVTEGSLSGYVVISGVGGE